MHGSRHRLTSSLSSIPPCSTTLPTPTPPPYSRCSGKAASCCQRLMDLVVCQAIPVHPQPQPAGPLPGFFRQWVLPERAEARDLQASLLRRGMYSVHAKQHSDNTIFRFPQTSAAAVAGLSNNPVAPERAEEPCSPQASRPWGPLPGSWDSLGSSASSSRSCPCTAAALAQACPPSARAAGPPGTPPTPASCACSHTHRSGNRGEMCVVHTGICQICRIVWPCVLSSDRAAGPPGFPPTPSSCACSHAHHRDDKAATELNCVKSCAMHTGVCTHCPPRGHLGLLVRRPRLLHAPAAAHTTESPRRQQS